MMKRLSALFAIVLTLSLAPGYTAAFNGSTNDTTTDIVCRFVPDQEACREADETTIETITEAVVNIVSIIIGVGSVLVLIVAGFMQVISAGNPDLVKRSKNAIIYALIGLVVVIFAQVIVRFVIGAV